MANKEQLAILKQGVEAWNKWREANPKVKLDLAGANLTRAKLSEADLTMANLTRAKLSEAYLREAYLTGAYLREADLSGADLSGADLLGADLLGAHLSGANLTRADLLGADLREVSLIGANLTRANLTGANLTGADLTRANLSEAHLSGADLTRAYLTGADLSIAIVNDTHFADLDLSEVQGLDTVFHRDSSHITIDTLVKSRGKIPENFLRGCGVPENFIEYLPALIGAMEPIQYYSCFISYSTRDEEFAKRLHSKMREHNLRVWFANEDLKGGHKLHEQIDEAIRVYDKFILVLSPESLRSKWVRTEIRRTRKAELANGRRKFFPIGLIDYRELGDWECFDPDTGVDLAAELREYYVPDFRDWKNHDSFEKAFAQLLAGLKAVDEPPAPRIEPQDMPQEPAKIIARKKQRLAILEEQAAIYGISVRPEVAIEIEELKQEIRRLEGRG